MKLKRIIYPLLVVFLLCTVHDAGAQNFIEEIRNFQKQDSLAFPPSNSILFVGSSSFRKWTDMQQYFPGYPVINRGFGGSSLPDVLRYAKDIITPYHAKQVVIYCGENDIAAADTITAEMVFKNFKSLYDTIRKNQPGVPLIYVSIKPSLLRWAMKDRMITANRLIKKFLLKHSGTRFVNVWDAMLGKDGKPLPDIFIEDRLHMNAKGYAIWQKLLTPYLLK